MATNTLTDAKVRAIKPSPKGSKTFDGGGLFLYTAPTGAKVWRLAYRFAGKAQTLVIGSYPGVTLADARAKRDEVKTLLAEGGDPKVARTMAAMTLTQAHDTYWGGRKDLSPSYLTNERRAFEMHVQPYLGSQPIRGITRADMLDTLNRLDARGRHDYVRKVRMWLGQLWDWAIEQGEASENPPRSIKADRAFGKRQVKHFASVELRDFARLMERVGMEGELQSVLALHLLALTWVRTNELRFMRWDEIDGDLWLIPAGKMKRKRDHLVPLSAPAMAILQKLKDRAGHSPYVFPSEHRGDRPISNNAVLALLYRMGYKGVMTGHGFRSVGSTWANENGYVPDVIERQLAHVPEDKVRSAYNRAQYLDQRREMMDDWGQWVSTAAQWVTSDVDAGSDQCGALPTAQAQ